MDQRGENRWFESAGESLRRVVGCPLANLSGRRGRERERVCFLAEKLTGLRDGIYRGFSQAFYREKLYESALGFKDLEDFMVNFWEKWALSKGKARPRQHSRLLLCQRKPVTLSNMK